MKRYLLFLLLLIAIVSASCNDNLSPKTDFKEEYILYCIVNADTSFQTAYLSRSYQVEGFDALENKTDPALEGAIVKLTVNGTSVYDFSETTAERTDTSRYKTKFKYYSLNNYKPADNDNVVITARLNNGKILISSTAISPVSYLNFEEGAATYPGELLNGKPAKGIRFTWKFLYGKYDNLLIYYAPKLEFIYSKTDNPSNKIKVEVPTYFLPSGDTYMPVYPNVSTNTSVLFQVESIEMILNKISEGDLKKDNYTIEKAEFTLLIMDKNLAAYIASESTFKDEFSVRIDASDFSSITGGLGVFGSVVSRKVKINFKKWYIESFGYKTAY